MTTREISQRITASLALIAMTVLTAPAMKAQCMAAARKAGIFAPELKSLQDPEAKGEEALSDEAALPQAEDQDENNRDTTILGFWKKVYVAGGALNDVGFEQFNAGGTELLNDSPVPDGGNNFCLGAWKKIGTRTYALVHPFFIFDGSGKKPIGISIERSHLKVSRDGNTFTGKWRQDNYDFSGNIVPDTHIQGTVSGTRIAPGLPFPFPFPL